MAGGRAFNRIDDEVLYRFEFPETPGALKVFLESLDSHAQSQRGWNICESAIRPCCLQLYEQRRWPCARASAPPPCFHSLPRYRCPSSYSHCNCAGYAALFHYRNQGGDIGHVLVGMQVAKEERSELLEFLERLGYRHVDETDNHFYHQFLL